jgi:hypothetical protein
MTSTSQSTNLHTEVSPQFSQTLTSTTQSTANPGAKGGFTHLRNGAPAINRKFNEDADREDSIDNNQGEGSANLDKKKKKKRKNKNKKKGGQNEEPEGPKLKDNIFDMSASLREPNNSRRDQQAEDPSQKDFTPLKDKLGQSFFDDQDSSEDEGMPDYKIGGYHPVHVGEILLDRYVIIQKLGWGHFSTVWLTKDLKYNSYVAMKVQKSAQHYLEAAYDEVEILD